MSIFYIDRDNMYQTLSITQVLDIIANIISNMISLFIKYFFI